MFRLATCNDLIRLKCQLPNAWFSGEHEWGLKQMGSLFCLEKIKQLNLPVLLEVGAGCNLFFSQQLGKDHEYWIVDEPGFYDRKKFKQANSRRDNTHFVDSLLGKFSNRLKNDFFDIVFSVSVLEHIAQQEIDAVCEDMFRIVKPGGYIIHSLDINREMVQTLGKDYFTSLTKSGFVFGGEYDINWTFDRTDPILLEPLSIFYAYYTKRKDDLWKKPRQIRFHMGTILIFASKPQGAD